ncbi:hypothetical protein [Niabella hibiscisoli]|uniref:hypothetical protein n=1 Tax=Niabella hibiscisoli TaxID=1825928 RepID=UPI001F10389F|nr:hypothetical protein [Niabella hibiscisoli]MCH5717035.1 hypothetical protein [Niabella hibiscisoli]
MRVLLTFFLVGFWGNTVLGQNPYIDSLVLRISGLQATGADTNYPVGIFPSQRAYLPGRKPPKEDDNIFLRG